MSEARLARFAEALKALGHPVRLRLFLDSLRCVPPGTTRRLEEGEAGECQRALAARLGLAPSTLSHHFKELRTAGLIRMRRQGRRVAFWIDPGTLGDLRAFLGMLDG